MSPTRAVIIGSLLGPVPGLILGIAIATVPQHAARKNVGPLVPVVVAARTMSEGHVLTMDDIDQRSFPEAWVTTSVVRPDSASYVVNQALQVPIAVGQPVAWAHIKVGGVVDDQVVDREIVEACAAEMAKRPALASPAKSIDELRSTLSGGR